MYPMYLAVVLPRRGGTQHVVGYILWVVFSVATLGVSHRIHRHLNDYEAILVKQVLTLVTFCSTRDMEPLEERVPQPVTSAWTLS